MYCDYFKLNEKPFNLTPDPRYLFLGKNHSEAFAQLLYATQEGAGFALFMGEIGTGKTTLCRALLNQLPEKYVPAFIFNPNMDELELYQTLNRELGIGCESASKNTLQYILNSHLINLRREGRQALLIIDEAQNLSQPVLEQIRLISNLETEKEKLIQIILVGQPELRSILEQNSLRQLKQRISVSCHLKPLNYKETTDYIRHRLTMAGGAHLDIFSRPALSRLYRFSKGTPRLINMLCDRALLAAYSTGKRQITGPMAGKCIKEMEGKVRSHTGLKKAAPVLTAAASLSMLVFAIAFAGVETEAKTHAPTQVTAGAGQQAGTAGSEPLAADELFSENAKVIAASSMLAVWNDNTPVSGKENRLSFVRLAKRRGLRCFVADMDYAQLRAVDYPAILELKDEKGRIGYMPVVRIWGKRLFTDRSGKKFMEKEWVLARWTGRTYIFWNDFKSLPKIIDRGHRGKNVRWLQQTLKKLGYGEIIPMTNFFGRKTQRLVIRFQIQNSLEASGRVGPLTKMFIYKRLPEYNTPRLS